MHGYLYTEHKFNFCASLSAGHTDSVEGGRPRLGDCPVPSFLPDWTMYVTVPTTRLNDINFKEEEQLPEESCLLRTLHSVLVQHVLGIPSFNILIFGLKDKL